jgi:hypothetical protein
MQTFGVGSVSGKLIKFAFLKTENRLPSLNEKRID